MIFDKFYRGKDQRYLVRGTGMGLPIAKAIIAAQQGNMSVTSQLGHGSVFSFTLPVDGGQKDARRTQPTFLSLTMNHRYAGFCARPLQPEATSSPRQRPAKKLLSPCAKNAPT